MATIKVHAGDFGKCDATQMFSIINFMTPGNWKGEGRALNELKTVEIASEESVKRLGGTVGWGIVGATLLGPVGLLAGLLLGGKKQQVTFVAVFKDGKKFLGTTDSKTYTKLAAAAF